MRQLFAVALVLAAFAVPGYAQHGNARGAGSSGFHGGFSGHTAVASHGGYSRAASSRYAGGPHVQGYRPTARVNAPGVGAPVSHLRSGGVSGVRPVFYNRGRLGRRGEHGRGVRYGYPGWADTGYLDDDGYNGDDSADSTGDSGMAAGNSDEQSADQSPDPYQPGLAEPSQSSMAVPSASPARPVAPALYDSNAVTLVFRDGRPAQKIHNYALTRTTLYVTDAQHREIPVADLDIVATEKANREAGVRFQLPRPGQ